MKIRTGFVSNSSSSSFIVAFAKVPESVDELKVLLFGEGEWFQHPHEDERLSTAEVAATVWRDIEGKQPMTDEAVREEMDTGHIYEIGRTGYPEYPCCDAPIEECRAQWEAWDAEHRAVTGKFANKFLAENWYARLVECPNLGGSRR